MNPEPMNTEGTDYALTFAHDCSMSVFMGSGLPLRGPRNDRGKY